MAELSFAQASALLKYVPETGKLFWLERPRDLAKNYAEWRRLNARFNGKEAFTALQAGYHVGSILGKPYRAHRVAWFLHHGEWPSNQIDHINGDRTDNRIINLRDVSHTVNQQNREARRDNTSGMSGIHWHKPTQKWHVRVGVDGRMKHIGYFVSFEEAIAARSDAHGKYGYTDRHGIAAAIQTV